uniref:Uncharacterized protein n=1 Tax=Vespula pensylvanica TaxID=30213 RepID=A0A834K7U2_VESPE|nr:hypothetical protein H0235_015681 [Vespula pensylvanica]
MRRGYDDCSTYGPLSPIAFDPFGPLIRSSTSILVKLSLNRHFRRESSRSKVDEEINEEEVCTLARLVEAKNGSSRLLQRRSLPFQEVDSPLHGCRSDHRLPNPLDVIGKRNDPSYPMSTL